ncbi:50S ribosomal protein L9 [Govanella unica]|uniref:Large ribosomal subunit protein bL9 n=1 Tax=Govanella unica TaxID=2975056 RepID=A0A9X3Z7M9_9PROT|nr:50S ribosomal protein L9 [Govania unica]MDA5194342.1 50S ribosomal protein L9 [Govania unica]
MQIILLERVEKLGQMGDVVTVKDGFARNFLLPRKKALRATVANLKRFESQRQDIEAHNLERRSDAQAAAEKIEGASVTLIRQAGEVGQLFGSVSARDIAAALTASGFKVDYHQVVLSRPIKSVGIHGVTVQLHPEVSVAVSVNVARSEAEAVNQAAGVEAPVKEEVGNFFENEGLAPSNFEDGVEL